MERAEPDEVAAVRLRLLIRGRWVAVLGQIAVLPPALTLGWLLPRHLALYGATVTVLVVANLLTARHLNAGRAVGPSLLLTELLVDLSALTVLLMLSGGAWNPLSPLLCVHAALGALLVPGPRSWLMLLALGAATTVVSLVPSLPPAVPDVRLKAALVLPAQWLVALVIFGLTAWLARDLEQHRALLRSMRAREERADRLRAAGALAAGVSHELATPLNTVRMRLDRMERRLGEDPDLAAAREGADRCEAVLRKMVERPLDPRDLRFEPVDIAALVRRVSASWSVDGRQAAVRVADPAPGQAVLPSIAFAQALLNLLDNAWEAMADPHATVDIEVGRVGASWRVAVRDHGPGWPARVRAGLGQPFLTTKPHGTGLGLYNAHALAVALGGVLRLEDAVPRGAIAAIVVPLDAGEGSAP
jgi:two-component system sensor histidine kinase RegB